MATGSCPADALDAHFQQIVPTINYQQLNEHIGLAQSPFYINTTLKNWETIEGQPRRAAVNSFGFSGTNAHLVIEEYLTKPQIYIANQSAIILLSAKNKKQLNQQVSNLRQYLQANESANLPDVAFTLQIGRVAMEERLAILVANKEILIQVLINYENGEESAFLTGNTKKDKQQTLVKTENQAAFVKVALQTKELKLLMELWVKGAVIDWKLL